jgi:hypothetical protein
VDIAGWKDKNVRARLLRWQSSLRGLVFMVRAAARVVFRQVRSIQHILGQPDNFSDPLIPLKGVKQVG